jgi:hypothetical protein
MPAGAANVKVVVVENVSVMVDVGAVEPVEDVEDDGSEYDIVGAAGPETV